MSPVRYSQITNAMLFFRGVNFTVVTLIWYSFEQAGLLEYQYTVC
jgi:hypothetical protein